MTKKELMGQLRLCFTDKQLSAVNDLLYCIPDGTEMGEFSSMDSLVMSKLDGDGDMSKNDAVLEIIVPEIRTWIIRNNPFQATGVVKDKIHKKRHVIIYASIGIIFLTALAGAVLTILGVLGVISEKMSGIVGAIIGSSDFLVGAVAFLIERHYDIKSDEANKVLLALADENAKPAERHEAEERLDNGLSTYVKGNGNTVQRGCCNISSNTTINK